MKLFLRFIHKSFLLILVVLVGCPTTEEINKTDPDTLLNQGIKHLNKGQYDKAVSDFTKAIETNPSAKAYYRRGIAYKDKAKSEFLKGSKIEKIDPKSAEAYYRRENAYVDGLVTIDELYPYVSDNVARASGQEQHPVKKGMVEGRFVFGVVR